MINGTLAAIGDQLKKAREKEGLTIDQVQKKTHIHSRVIIALEEARCDEILTVTYVKSFLKQYADFLGLDSKQIIADYLALHGHEAPAHQEAMSSSEKTESEKTKAAADAAFDAAEFRRGMLAVFAIGLIVIFSVFIVFGVMKTVRWHMSQSGKVEISQDKKAKIVRPVSQTKKDARKKQAKSGAVRKDASAASSKSEDKQWLVPKDQQLKLTLSIKNDVLVQVRNDGVLLFKRVLTKGMSEMIIANESIILSLGRGDAVELSLNGKPLQVPSKGAVSDLEITRRGMRVVRQ